MLLVVFCRGFRRSYIDLPEGIMAFYHPLFRRDKPELASSIVCPDIKAVKSQVARRQPGSNEIAYQAPPSRRGERHARERHHQSRSKQSSPEMPQLPPSVRIAALRRGQDSSKKVKGDPPSARITSDTIPEHLRRRRPAVVDLTDDADDYPARSGETSRAWA